MGNQKSVLKVYVDEKKKKVMFAEAEEDFVEILFSFFTFPLGTIARLLVKYADSKDIKVESLTTLYQSVMNLNVKHFSEEWYKDRLVKPINSSASICQLRDAVFLKKKAKFIITDDLNVVPIVLDTSIALLNSLGVENIDLLDERTMYFGSEEFSNLLKWSLLTDKPLTNLVLGESRPFSSSFTNSTLSNPAFMSSNSDQITQTVKLLVQKSKNKVLCAQVENGFVELLFSFLTIPLGAYVHLTMDSSSPLGISKLYHSISCLADGNYLKSEDAKNILLCPKLSAAYQRVTDLLPIYEVNTRPGSFLKEQAAFIVADNLKVTATPSIATISKFYTPQVPIGDMELLELSIGEQEALLLLKASLTSTSALTDSLKAFEKKPKDHVPNNTFAGDGGRDSEEEADFTLEDGNDTDASFIMLD